MNKWTSILIAIVGALVLISVGIYNMFPLVTSDTGAYIGNIYGNLLPRDRPVTYSIFLYFSSFKMSLWLTIFFQSLWLYLLIHKLTEQIIDIKSAPFVSLFLVFGLSFGTTVSWFASQIMADIFTPILFLSICLILLNKNKRPKYLQIFYFISYVVALLMHNSNLLIAFGSLLLLWIFLRTPLYKQQIKTLSYITITVYLLLGTTHFFAGHGFVPGRSSEVFLMGKLSENGILSQYLNEHCASNNWNLCKYKDQLPAHAWDYLWSENSPITLENGTWESFKPEHKEILKGVFTSPKYVLQFAYKSIFDGIVQFFSYQVGDGLFANPPPSNAYYQVQKFYPNELIYYNKSRQNSGHLEFTSPNLFNLIVLALSLFITLGLVSFKQYTPSKNMLILFLLLAIFLVLNAWFTANFANILPRLHARVIWLIPFVCWLSWIEYYKQKTGWSQQEEPFKNS